MSVHTSGSAPLRVYSSVWQTPCRRIENVNCRQESIWRWHLTCVENLDSDLVCARVFHLDIFELEWLACTPAYGSLALDDFPFSFRHNSIRVTEPEQCMHSSGVRRRSQITVSPGKPGRLRTLYLNVLPKRLLQACKCLSLIRTIVIPWAFSKRKVFLNKISTSTDLTWEAGHRNVSRMLRLL